jgi:molecular chaperone GrpE
MKNKHNNDINNNVNEELESQVNDIPDVTAEETSELSETEKLKADIDSANEQLAKEKKEYMFLLADFDNFRKRVIKEKSDLIKNAGEKVLGGLLPIVDDFERGLQALATDENAQEVKQGMELIYNKLIKFLSDNGVKAMDTDSVNFDTELHEAIAMIPATDDEQKGKIIDTTQKGYLINDKVLRHAKVVVAQ